MRPGPNAGPRTAPLQGPVAPFGVCSPMPCGRGRMKLPALSAAQAATVVRASHRKPGGVRCSRKHRCSINQRSKMHGRRHAHGTTAQQSSDCAEPGRTVPDRVQRRSHGGRRSRFPGHRGRAFCGGLHVLGGNPGRASCREGHGLGGRSAEAGGPVGPQTCRRHHRCTGGSRNRRGTCDRRRARRAGRACGWRPSGSRSGADGGNGARRCPGRRRRDRRRFPGRHGTGLGCGCRG